MTRSQVQSLVSITWRSYIRRERIVRCDSAEVRFYLLIFPNFYSAKVSGAEYVVEQYVVSARAYA